MTVKCENKIPKKYAIVVPCYNEASRFQFAKFKNFADNNKDVLICLVDDGSKDNTLAILRGLNYECSENVCVYSLDKNSGKSEAVRQGMMFVHENFESDQIGFLDADLATTLEEWLEMAKYKESKPHYGAIVGSRIKRLGANIQRDDTRKLLSLIIKGCIKKILKASFQDTQCGAKIFNRNLVPYLFLQKFRTPWLFDVEIFLRLQKKFGRKTLSNGVLEFPLMQWNEIDGSKLKIKDSLKIPFQLLQLHYIYTVKPRFNNERVFVLD